MPVSWTNIGKIQRPTNVFEGVVEQMYIKLYTQQDFWEMTPVRILNLYLPVIVCLKKILDDFLPLVFTFDVFFSILCFLVGRILGSMNSD